MNFGNMGPDGKDDRPAATAAAMGLARQSSIYSLTLEELQHTLGGLGKDFGSMNMDEFLKNIWIAEETQAMATAVGFGMASGGSGLQRQGSLTLPRTISLKTVDEVWRGIASDNNGDATGGQWSNSSGNFLPPPQPATYGEMTLEEFLVKAGVVREDAAQCSEVAVDGGASNGGGGTNVMFGGFPVASCSSNPGLGLGFTPGVQSNGGGAVIKIGMEEASANLHADRLQSSYNTSVQLMSGGEIGGQKGVANGTFGAGDSAVKSGSGLKGGGGNKATTMGGSPLSNDDLSSLSPASCVFTRGQGRKAGSMEKAVERRQKRMIKNRESAARSRARKQAYTMELEAEVANLKEKNQELMAKQAKILEMQRQQILESLEKQGGLKKQRLRRTQTGPW